MKALSNKQVNATYRVPFSRCPFVVTALFTLLGTGLVIGHGDLELRIAQITRQINSTTSNPATLYLQRAELQREHKDWKAAAEDYDLAARANPKLIEVEVRRAGMLVDSGQYETAMSRLDGLIGKAPQLGEAWILRGRARAGLGKRTLAIRDYQQGVQKLEHPTAVYFLELARLLGAESRSNDALQTIEEGLRKVGAEATLHAYGLELEEQAGNAPGALRHLNALVDLAQRKETWLVKRGKLLIQMGRADEGRQSYEAALAQIGKLPGRLQKSPSMEKLRNEIERELATLAPAKPEK